MPATSAIHAAEQRLEQSRQNMRAGFGRARLACREKLGQPSTLALAAGAALLIGYRLARRPAPSNSTVPTGRIALVAAFAMRYAMQHFAHGWLRKLAA